MCFKESPQAEEMQKVVPTLIPGSYAKIHKSDHDKGLDSQTYQAILIKNLKKQDNV